ncbi:MULTISPECIES: TetR/AcrR family transcriptional regulator [unclassified Streptomyces]|uniref:TetR/AcrR family transcriptional regulator n=1 Tax=unclassified Streptomyces TaxID=2593676 RepID=UPI00224E6229|nr:MULTISPECIES: TetR/AcrR family transcriptional regulator [unclassified Streptomyces]MCX5143854.1 TetR/AcrR family transcriptional regulator [Streptomyces sp. NBC_00338]WRZ68269.1 TetR/AcrR family transcriptional regulator [Streptomyces sp. NBC_01257]
MAGERRDGRVERGNRTRQLVLARAAAVASVEGLDGLSLGRLATDLRLSKSGVFALFGSKEELQLATVRTAVAVYDEHVVRPTRAAPAGLGRILRMYESWIAYSRERVFPGGCFFYAALAEFDAREGAVHDALVAAQAGWVTFVERRIEEARTLGEIREDCDAAQLAFEIIAFLELANGDSVLRDSPESYPRAARAILGRLRAVAVDASSLPAAP